MWVRAAASTLEQLQEIAARGGGDGDESAEGQLPLKLLAGAPLAAASELMERYDARLGGFGAAPKFPRPSEINALLAAAQQARLSGDASKGEELLGAALHTLRAYAAGGMYDHLGGGFHRYSVDAHLHVPHVSAFSGLGGQAFEKMLYDNPQLVSTYLDAIAADAAAAAPLPAPAGAPAGAPHAGDGPRGGGGGSGAAEWGVFAVRGVLDYLLRDMRHPQGGFFSAE
ncbi:Spermatogeneis-associated protein, partial [Monoraphidium neglectum]